MLNSIRPDALASLLLNGEAKTGNRPVKGERQFRDLSLESTVSSKIGMHGVIGDRMVGSWRDMNQGSRTGKGTAFMVCRRPEELYPGGDRASVVAKKRGNARGVKGGRKVETLNERMKGNDTVNVQWTQFGEEQKQVRKTFDPSPESIGCPGNGRQRLNEPESSGDASADLLESNHQLESRIQEIWPSGSEGGAKLTLSLPLLPR